MFPLLIKAKDAALDILFPPICLNCQKSIDDRNKLFCGKCLSLIKLNNTLFCPICRARLAENKRICHPKSQYLLAAAGNYNDEVLKNLIHFFKYKSFKNIAPILGEITLNYIRNLKLSGVARSREAREIRNFVMVPIPLHSRKERQRGFNQSKLLAEFLAEKLNLELIEPLIRIKNTEPQAKIKKPEKRLENIAGCFQIKNAVQVESKNILLVDDVFTSGNTLSEAVKILKQNGANRIIALVLAKA